jgi:hypothetical protein
MTMTMTRDQAVAAVAAQTAQRDGIQANLLELDDSFGKRLLDGASLAGETRKRWDAAAVELITLWDMFTAYSTVLDRAAELLGRTRRSSGPELASLTTLLTGTSVRTTRAPVPLARRDLTDSGYSELTIATAVQTMTMSFAGVAAVVTAAETVWNALSGRLHQIGADLDHARERAAGLADDALTGVLAAAAAELSQLHGVLNSDPLAFWQHGRVDSARLDRLQKQASAALFRTGELARLREEAQQRVATAGAAVAAAGAAWKDAATAWERAAARIAPSALPPAPRAPDLDQQLAALDALAAAGRWSRLAAELDVLERETATATRHYRDTEQAAVALLGKRDELRGLLGGYQAKAVGLGAAEDEDLAVLHDQAHELLRTAPCDLCAAAAAVTRYQQAILGFGRGRRQA